ncbi:DUF6318 family protein [Demequina sp. NBRC 110055]|uniref:DUF6318 family protein n=1 Tax=Demequina sp. NBRC 110055 TaxID=1570344 RepID=UPI001184DF6B|nr:DUF6318 family protein [Demequina sp. NBRC 110055]
MGADRGLLQTATRAVAGLGVLVAVLAGCTNDPEPIVTTTPTLSPTASPAASSSPSPTPTPSPSATALTEEEVLAQIPENARNESLGDAFAFAQFFVIESQRMMIGFDTELFAALSSTECVFCNNSLELADDLQQKDLRIEGGEIEISDALPDGGLQADGTWRIEFEIDVGEQRTLDADGSVVETVPPNHLVASVVLNHDGSRWQVEGVGAKEST